MSTTTTRRAEQREQDTTLVVEALAQYAGRLVDDTHDSGADHARTLLAELQSGELRLVHCSDPQDVDTWTWADVLLPALLLAAIAVYYVGRPW